MKSVILYYGPYEACQFLKYRTQRLHGLLNVLSQKEYEVEIKPFLHLNRLSIEMAGSIIYQCDIRNLLFNLEYEDDVVCQRIVEVIEEAESRINTDTNIPKFPSTKDAKRYVDICQRAMTKEFFESYISLIYEHHKHLQHVEKISGLIHTDNHHGSRQSIDKLQNKDNDDNEYEHWDFAYSIVQDIVEHCHSENQATYECLQVDDFYGYE